MVLLARVRLLNKVNWLRVVVYFLTTIGNRPATLRATVGKVLGCAVGSVPVTSKLGCSSAISAISPTNITYVYSNRPLGVHGLNSFIRLFTLDCTERNDFALYRKSNPVSLLELVSSPPSETNRWGPKVTVTIIKALAKSSLITMMPTEVWLVFCHFTYLVV